MGFQHEVAMTGKGFVYKVIERLLSNSTDRIVCISKAEYKSAIENGIDNGAKLEIIENGIDVQAVQAAQTIARETLGIPETAFVVGMIGRLSPQKAPDVFIKSAKLISEKIPNTYYIIVGNGEEEAKVKQYAQKNGLHLIVTGWTENPYAYLKIFDVAVLLSRWEGFGLAIVEYLAAEKNFVATNVDAIPTIVENGIDGELVNVDSPEEVADKVYFYYTHPVEAQKMRDTAKRKVTEKYDVSRVAQQHKELFNNLFTH